MIGAILGLALTMPQVVVVAKPEATAIAISAVVRTGELSAREWAAAEVLCASLPLGTRSYTRWEMFSATAPSGIPIRCSVMPDHLSIEMGVLPEQLGTGLDILRDILDRARLDEEDVRGQLETVLYRRKGLWEQVLAHAGGEATGLTKPWIEQIYRNLVRPDRTVIAVAGPVDPVEVLAAASNAFGDWRVDVRVRTPDRGAWVDTGRNTVAVGSVELRSPVIPPDLEGSSVALLAAAALGVGKTSSLFRIAREEMGLSYAQEAFLYPDSKGFRLRVVALSKSVSSDMAEQLKAALLRDIDTWSENTLEAARAAVARPLDNRIVRDALRLRVDRPSPLSGEALIAAYLRMKFGDVAPISLSDLGAAVTLERLKTDARRWITESQTLVRNSA